MEKERRVYEILVDEDDKGARSLALKLITPQGPGEPLIECADDQVAKVRGGGGKGTGLEEAFFEKLKSFRF